MKPTLFGIQAGFGAPRGADTMAALKAAGCRVVRVQLFTDHDDAACVSAAVAEEIVGEVIDAGLEPYVLIRTPEQVKHVPKGRWIEFYNEPDLKQFRMPLALFQDRLWPIIRGCEGRNRLAVGGVSNLLVTHPFEPARGLTWLAQLPWAEIPRWVAAVTHWYPEDPRPHDSHIRAFYGWGKRQSRDADIDQLKCLVQKDRDLVLSESGWWDHPEVIDPTTGSIEPARTEDDIVAWYAEERAFWIKHHYRIAIGFQLDSEPHEEGSPWGPEHGYGFRELGTVDVWKDRARAWFGEPA